MSEFFPDVPKVQYGGPKSRNPLEFKHYNPDEVVGGKTLKDHLRFSVVYWHTFSNPLSDPFGVGTAVRPWDDGTPSVENAQRKAKVAFEFFEKLGAPYYAFHDRDVAPEGKTLKESHANLDAVVKVLKDEQARTGVKLLWGTANLFSNPRYVHGAATSPNLDVFAFAAAQVKKALEVTHELNGAGYTFWGGREGYSTLLNTDMKRELDHLARFLHMAVDYKKEIGFNGPFYIEPKPKEPTKHQYDSDAAACLNFLRTYDLLPHFKLNLETNHATLAGHEMMHELEVAAGAGALGSIDANTGDPLLGWDTDQFPTSIYLTTQCMLVILGMGGFDGRG
ncbi:MAG: xylose isomerase [Isosphaeraceae bacterium]